jgi:anti-sigma B factor antagonist
MILRSLDIDRMSFQVDCSGERGLSLLGRLASLIMVAGSCSVRSITCSLPEKDEQPYRRAARDLALRNGLKTVRAGAADEEIRMGKAVLTSDSRLTLLRDIENSGKYTILLNPDEESVNLSAVCSYLIASILGFGNADAFEVRMSVYELLMNIIEHGTGMEDALWIRIEIEKAGERIHLSITDRGGYFDPTEKVGDFDLGRYISSGKRRGLGLIMVKKLAERMKYSRELNHNRVFLEKSMKALNNHGNEEKEEIMSEFTITGPEEMDDGGHVVILRGYLDTNGSLLIEDLLSRLLKDGITELTVDFTDVSFVSSAGIGILIGMVSTIREEGGSIKFNNVSQNVSNVFKLLNLDDFFELTSENARI